MTYYKSSHVHNNSVINGIGRIGTQWGGKYALWNDETMTNEFVKRAKDFIANRDDSKPFFHYLCSQCVHVPRAPNPRFRGKSELSYRGDSIVELDWATGEILKMLEDNGLTDNTIVICSSDNGPAYYDGYNDGTTVSTSTKASDRGHYASGPYRGGKYQIYKGGTRVPLIVRWPAKLKAGKTDALFNQIDLIASFAALLEINLEDNQTIDSRNARPTLLGKDTKDIGYTIEESGKTIALRQGYWKYIMSLKKEKNLPDNYTI